MYFETNCFGGSFEDLGKSVTLLVFLLGYMGESTANCFVRDDARLGIASAPVAVLLNDEIDR